MGTHRIFQRSSKIRDQRCTYSNMHELLKKKSLNMPECQDDMSAENSNLSCFFLNQIVHTICIECTVKLTRIVELLASCRLVVYSQECYDWISSEVSRPKVNKRCSGGSRSYLFFPFTWWNQLWLDWTRYSHGPWPFHSSLPSHQNRFGFTSNVRYFIENTGVKKRKKFHNSKCTFFSSVNKGITQICICRISTLNSVAILSNNFFFFLI